MKKALLIVLAIAAVFALTSCAGENPLIGSPGTKGVAGFWSGLWHGWICPIAFVISLFNHNVTIFEVHNSGGWYSFGFVIGAGAWGMLGGHGAAQRSKSR